MKDTGDQEKRQMLLAFMELQARQTQLAIEQSRVMRALCAPAKVERKGPTPAGPAGRGMSLVKKAG